MKRAALIAVLLGWNCAAHAQTSPGLTQGQVPTAGQWNSFFAAKQDFLGTSPLLSSGGALTGKLTLNPSSANAAGLNIPSGATPTSSVSGDIWVTTGGLFANINGSVYNYNTVTGANMAANAVKCNPNSSVGPAQDCPYPIQASLTSTVNVATYDGVTTTGKAAWKMTSADNSGQSGLERYSGWFGNTSQGTGDGTPAATTFALGCSAIKANWTTTTIAGEFVCMNVVARGGDNNALTSGDTGGITVNVASSFSNNLAQQFEGVSLYAPGGSTTGSLAINTQIGSIRATGLDTGSDTGIGFYTQAQNGLLGHAFAASNLCAAPLYGTCSKWLDFLNYLYDDGTHTAYNAFNVSQSGQLTLAGFGAVNTNQKTIRVGTSVTNNLEIINAAQNTIILTLTDVGVLAAPNVNAATAFNAGANGAASGVVQINGSTSGNSSFSVDATSNLQIAGGGAGVVKFGASGSFSANASVATVLGSIGPVGSHTTVQTWFTIIDSGGTARYIPAF